MPPFQLNTQIRHSERTTLLMQELETLATHQSQNLRRLEAQRNALNAQVRLLREELHLLQEPGSYVGEVVKLMGKKKVRIGRRFYVIHIFLAVASCNGSAVEPQPTCFHGCNYASGSEQFPRTLRRFCRRTTSDGSHLHL